MTGVQSIDRAFAILETLADGPQGVTAIARRVRLPKSSTARLLGALRDRQAVDQLGDGRYCVGPALGRLAADANPAGQLAALARPHLASIADATGEIATIGIPDGRHVLYLGQVGGHHEVSVRDWTGVRALMHQTSAGQVLLAGLPNGQLSAYLAQRLDRSSVGTITDPNTLRWRLAAVAEAGYGWVEGEYAEGLSSVAAGVADATGRLVCAIGLHGPSFRFPPPGRKAEIGRLVAVAAARMAHALRVGA